VTAVGGALLERVGLPQLPPGLADDLDGLLRWSLAGFGASVPIATSMSAEDLVLLEAAARAGAEVGVVPRAFFLDTGRIPEATYELLERVRSTYRVRVDVYSPAAAEVEALLDAQGPLGFRRSVGARRECCRVRKLGPLARALAGAPGWIAGLRRAQSVTRSEVELLEPDPLHAGRWKLNPLAHWSDERLWRHVETRQLPVHPLYGQGYTSIGCAPCTRAVAPGDDVRAGRWWWEQAEHKECGLHPGGARHG
jgi:phosphoadenosine phosphosulfate reductase